MYAGFCLVCLYMIWLIHSQGGLLPHSDPRWWPSLYWHLYGVCEIRPCSNWWRLPSRYNPNSYTIENDNTYVRNEANVNIHAEIRVWSSVATDLSRSSVFAHGYCKDQRNPVVSIIRLSCYVTMGYEQRCTSLLLGQCTKIRAFEIEILVNYEHVNVLFSMWYWPCKFCIWIVEFIFRKNIAVFYWPPSVVSFCKQQN